MRFLQQQWPGDLLVPERALGLVVLAQGGESGWRGLRQRQAAQWVQWLQQQRLATLPLEAPDAAAVPAAAAATEARAMPLLQALDALHNHAALATLPVGLLGSGSAAAAALQAAALRPQLVGALVLRDAPAGLPEDWLARVTAPTMLIVGGADAALLESNRAALRALRCKKRLEVIPATGQRVDEPGTLQGMAGLAGSWFVSHLGGSRP